MFSKKQAKLSFSDDKEWDIDFPQKEKKGTGSRSKIKGIIIYMIIFIFITLFFIFLFGSMLHIDIMSIPLPKWIEDKFDSGHSIDKYMEKSSYRLISKIFKNSSGNKVWSPLVTSLALSLLLEGSRNKTNSEITSAMNWNAFSLSDIRSYFNEILSKLDDGTKAINIANRMFIEKSIGVNDLYINNLKKYKADVIRVDFNSKKKTLSLINHWGFEKSEGLIQELIPSGLLDSATVGIISSLITVRGKWIVPFDKNFTKEAKFLLENGNKANVKMMHGSGHFKYGYFPEYKFFAVELPYDIQDVVMIVLLPENLQQFKELLYKSDGEFLIGLQSKMKNASVEICLPKFKINTKLLLEEELRSLGIVNLFNSQKSNLEGISSNANFYIQKIIQGVQIKVDEESTEGSASSSSIIGSRSLVESMRMDRPFIFYIQEKKYGSVLFWGEFNKPIN